MVENCLIFSLHLHLMSEQLTLDVNNSDSVSHWLVPMHRKSFGSFLSSWSSGKLDSILSLPQVAFMISLFSIPRISQLSLKWASCPRVIFFFIFKDEIVVFPHFYIEAGLLTTGFSQSVVQWCSDAVWDLVIRIINDSANKQQQRAKIL